MVESSTQAGCSQGDMNRNSDRNACEDLMDGDPMKLKSYNHPGIILVSTCLVGTNYRS